MKVPFSMLSVVVFFASFAFAAPTRVAITVDDLPDHMDLPKGWTRLMVAEKMLQAFKKHNVKEAYGFTNASKVVDHDTEEVLKAWVSAGYPLGNHSFSHMDLTTNSAEDFIADVEKNDRYLSSFPGAGNFKFFRYPYLHEGDSFQKRNAVIRALKKMKYQVAHVTMDFTDWAWNNPFVRCQKLGRAEKSDYLLKSYVATALRGLDVAKDLSQTLLRRQIPFVLLLHVGVADALAMDQMLQAYKENGVEFITLAEALSDPIYSSGPDIAARSHFTLFSQIMRARGLDSSPSEVRPPDNVWDLCK